MNCKSMMMQGDSYNILLSIKVNNSPINVEDYEIIEFMIGDLKKYWTPEYDSEVQYQLDGRFRFPISQEESFNMVGPQLIQVRLKDKEGFVYGKKYGYKDIMLSESEEIL